jgi:hypothetical protein
MCCGLCWPPGQYWASNCWYQNIHVIIKNCDVLPPHLTTAIKNYKYLHSYYTPLWNLGIKGHPSLLETGWLAEHWRPRRQSHHLGPQYQRQTTNKTLVHNLKGKTLKVSELVFQDKLQVQAGVRQLETQQEVRLKTRLPAPARASHLLLRPASCLWLTKRNRGRDPRWWLGHRSRQHELCDSKTPLRCWSHTWWK